MMSEEDWGKEVSVTIRAGRKEKSFQITFIYLSAYKKKEKLWIKGQTISDFHVPHDATCFLQKTVHKFCFQFLLGETIN